MKLQFCAKVMQTKFDELREYSTKTNELLFGAIFRRYFGRPIVCLTHAAIFRAKFRGTWQLCQRNFMALSDISSELSFVSSDFSLALNDSFILFHATRRKHVGIEFIRSLCKHKVSDILNTSSTLWKRNLPGHGFL